MASQSEMMRVQKTQKIRELNDRLRQTGQGGKVMLTRAVASLPPPTLGALLDAIRAFDAFTPDNDPWGEHDFGSVLIDSETYFFKIDAYDINLEFGSPDAADETVTRRVLTVMAAADY
jgi:hypothetical protein